MVTAPLQDIGFVRLPRFFFTFLSLDPSPGLPPLMSPCVTQLPTTLFFKHIIYASLTYS